jgi:hypothetical protein
MRACPTTGSQRQLGTGGIRSARHEHPDVYDSDSPRPLPRHRPRPPRLAVELAVVEAEGQIGAGTGRFDPVRWNLKRGACQVVA